MPKFLNRIGMRYGRLLVVEYKGKDKRGKHLWLCKCDCGNEKIVCADNLSSGKSKSCGCLKKEFLAKSGNQYALFENREEAILRKQYSHLKQRHKKNNMIGEIMDYETFAKLSYSKCHYCGIEYSKILKDNLNESTSKKFLSDTVIKVNGIDRIDSTLGYTIENSVPCCSHCNCAKHIMTLDEFMNWIKKVYEYNFKNY